MLTNKIYEIIQNSKSGIKCTTVAKQLNIAINTSSGILSMLKGRGIVTNRDGRWFAEPETPIVKTIKLRLLDINTDNFDIAWNEGYLSAFADYKIINEREFELLLEWLSTIYE